MIELWYRLLFLLNTFYDFALLQQYPTFRLRSSSTHSGYIIQTMKGKRKPKAISLLAGGLSRTMEWPPIYQTDQTKTSSSITHQLSIGSHFDSSSVSRHYPCPRLKLKFNWSFIRCGNVTCKVVVILPFFELYLSNILFACAVLLTAKRRLWDVSQGPSTVRTYFWLFKYVLHNGPLRILHK